MNYTFQFFSGLGLCIGFALIFIKVASFLGLMDIPNGRHKHGVPVPKAGGLALIAVLALGWILGVFRVPFRSEEFAGILFLATFGFLDDRFALRARWKALAGLFVAVVLAIASSHKFLEGDFAPLLFGIPLPHQFAVYFVLLLILYWSLPQAINLIDGANGLALGFSLIVLGALWIAGHGHPFLVGTLVVLLAFNWPRARHFLGDCGALPLGMILAILVMQAATVTDTGHILWIFAYPIVDVSMVVVIRISQGRNPGQADRSHLHFQWVDRWPSMEAWRVPLLLFLAACCASEIFLQGLWRIIPWFGLFCLISQAVFFWVSSVARIEEEVPAQIRIPETSG